MKKIKNVLAAVLCLTMMLFVIPAMVKAEEIDSKDFITLVPFQGLGEVFDYTYENGEVVLKVKDVDLYKALMLSEQRWADSRNDIDSDIDDTIREGSIAYSKLSKYLKEVPVEGEDRTIITGTIGLGTHIYFPENVTKITFSASESGDSSTVDGKFTLDEADMQDENGKNYYYYDRTGILFDVYNDIDPETYKEIIDWVPLQKWGNWDYNWGYTYNFVGYDANNNEVFTSKIRFSYELGETSTTDENTGVSVTGQKDIDTTLAVENLAPEADVYKELVKQLEGKKVVGAYEVKLNGSYEGKLSVSFNVDSKYNDQKATVLHKKSDGTVETFEAVVAGGKVTVEVSELSPFIVALSDVKADSTPTLGVPSYIEIASLLVLCAGVCLIKVLKRD